MTATTKLLIQRKDYLASGIHIGMKQRTADMKEFIYKIRDDGLSILNLKKIDERIIVAAKFLARANKIYAAGRKMTAQEAVKKFGEVIGTKVCMGRFLPGTFTNPTFKNYFEADIVLVGDPLIDYQVMKEAVSARIPIIAICDTFNETKDIDLIIPANNKGKKSLAMLFWLLTREILKERGVIKSDSDFKYEVTDFGKEEQFVQTE